MCKLPNVSVVVPTFNSGHFLRWTLESIAAQTCDSFECIVVDDGSTDDSLSTVKDILKDQRFFLIRHKMNVGHGGARNTGLRAARGKYVTFLDSDDLMMTNSLETRLATCRWAARKSDRFAGSYCGSVAIHEGEKTPPASINQDLPFVNFTSSNGLCPFNANQPMIRRDVLRACGGFSHSLKQAEDFDLWQRILRAGYSFAPAKHAAVTYRRRSGSTIRQQPLVHLSTALKITDAADRPLAEDQLDWSQYRLTKQISAYSAQERKINRVLEFSGMAIVGPEAVTVEQLRNLFHEEIPDLTKLVHPVYPIEHRIHQGAKRQVGDLNEQESERITSLLEAISLPTESESSGPATTRKVMVYDDPPKDRIWFSDQQRKVDVVFVPHKDYHVWTISLIGDILSKGGISFAIVDISPEWRDGGVREAAKRHGLALIGLSEFVLGQYAPRAIVTFNDWDPVTRPIVVAAKDAGVQTVAIVEGIQDYDDADLHWRRHAYKSSDIVLLPGDFDRKYFVNSEVRVDVAGVPRIESLRRKPPRIWDANRNPRVLINSNFSYGVLEDHRDSWLTSCVNAVIALGMTPVISRHPGDKGVLFPEFVSNQDFYTTLEECDISVQRFASGVLEALSRNVGVIYHNPHGEKVDKFQADTMGAYVVTKNSTELTLALGDWWKLHKMAEANGSHFLDHHAGDLEVGAATRCAMALTSNLGDRPGPESQLSFRRNLEALDMETRAFSVVRPKGELLFPVPDEAGALLARMRRRLAPPAEHPSDIVKNSPTTAQDDSGQSRLKTVRLDLPALAAQLLLDPKSGRTRLKDDSAAVAQAVAALPEDSPVRQHFQRVRAFVEAE